MVHRCLRMGQQVEMAVASGAASPFLQHNELRIMHTQFAGELPDIGGMPQAVIVAAGDVETARPVQISHCCSIIETILWVAPFSAILPDSHFLVQLAGYIHLTQP